jgi:hypothetical protein
MDASAGAAAAAFADFGPEPQIQERLHADLAAATKDHHNVLVDFGSPDSPESRALTALGSDPRAAELLTGYHLVSIDVGPTGEKDIDALALQMWTDLNETGVPELLVLGPGDNILASLPGRAITADQLAAFLTKWDRAESG